MWKKSKCGGHYLVSAMVRAAGNRWDIRNGWMVANPTSS